MDAANALPLLALPVGDPAGIGPEICAAALADARVRSACRVLAIGPAELRPAGVPRFDPAADPRSISSVAWLESESPGPFVMGKAQAGCGRAALAALRAAVDLAMARRVDGIVSAPVSKEALHLAGEKVEGQTELLGRWSGAARFEMVAIAGSLRVMLLTRHLPLRAALDAITPERVLDRLTLFDEALRGLGIARPRLALAGINPHAGEGGILGREELDLFPQALERARARGIDVTGPLSPDTVFLSASRGRYDGVLAMYHDQAFIATKLLAPERGMTWIAGLPFLRISPAHGTAFDIAGQGKASAENLVAALGQAGEWGRSRDSRARGS